MRAYEADWESLLRYTVPDWFKDAKLGIFIHWGVYAVPAYQNEWYPRNMYIESSPEYIHHRETWGPQDAFGYKDFIPMFKAESWDEQAWVNLFQAAGAKYVVPVAEHHDGFPMYDSAFTNYNAARMGPCRDIVTELAGAVRQAGLKFGVSSHRAFNARYYTFSEAFDTNNPDHHKLYGIPRKAEEPVSYPFILDWYARTRELVDRFSPDVLWFDFGWHRDEFEPWRPRVVAYYYNHALAHGYEPVLQYKDKIPAGVAVLDIERGKLDSIREDTWQTDTSVSYRSWCYIKEDVFKSATVVIHDLVDIVSKNGNLLLNVGPKPDGTFPQEVEDLLQNVGAWLRINGEAIYGTRPWITFGEGPTGVPEAFREDDQEPFSAQDVRYTRKGDTLFAILMGWPGQKITLKSLQQADALGQRGIAKITMLGADGELPWAWDGGGLTVKLPEVPPCEHAYVLKIVPR